MKIRNIDVPYDVYKSIVDTRVVPNGIVFTPVTDYNGDEVFEVRIAHSDEPSNPPGFSSS